MSQRDTRQEATDAKRTEAAQLHNSNYSVAAISANTAAAIALKTLTEQQAVLEFKHFVSSIKPHAEAALAAVANSLDKKISEIAGPIWDEFKAMNWAEKLFVVLGTALVVGAVGYFSWKLIAANWPALKKAIDDQMKSIGDKLSPDGKIEDHAVVKKIMKAFESGQENFELNPAHAELLIKFLFKTMTAGLIFSQGFLEIIKADGNGNP